MKRLKEQARLRTRQVRKCIVCGKEFKPNSGHQKSCSDKCSQERIRELGRIKSQKIRQRKKEAEKAGIKLASWRNTPKKCVHCGKEFMASSPPQTLCSDECKQERRAILGRERNLKYRQRQMVKQGIAKRELPKIDKVRIFEFDSVEIDDLYRHVFHDDKTATKLSPITETILEPTQFEYYFKRGRIECYKK